MSISVYSSGSSLAVTNTGVNPSSSPSDVLSPGGWQVWPYPDR